MFLLLTHLVAFWDPVIKLIHLSCHSLNYRGECALRKITKKYHVLFSGNGGVDVESWDSKFTLNLRNLEYWDWLLLAVPASVWEFVCHTALVCIALPLINTAAHSSHPLSREKRIHQSPALRYPCSICLAQAVSCISPYRARVEACRCSHTS